jgi:hypothetical protein
MQQEAADVRRPVAAVEHHQTREDQTRVPDPHEMLDSAERARRILHEINAREAHDTWAEEDERAAELGRRHDDQVSD